MGCYTHPKPTLVPAKILAGWPQTFKHLPLLAQLLQGHADVGVVVSSLWRLFLSEQELADLLHPIKDWYAGALHSRMTQLDEAITQWLSEHAVADFVVLDDVPRFFTGYLCKWAELIVCKSVLDIAEQSVMQRLQTWLARTC